MGEFREFGAPPKGDSADGHPEHVVHVDADVLADLGHQLRNQLNAVVGAAGLLATGAETSEERELAAIVETGAGQVARIIDEWLDSATIESGEFELALHPLDIRSAVESCLALVSGAARSKGLDISFDAAADVPSVVIGDSRRIEQILLTLLHGAVERTYRGGISVELSSEDRGGLVALHFKIRDTGRGVPARILRGAIEGVTGPYDRLEPGDRLAVLSLRTTKQLVGLMDGDLRVEQGGVEAGPDAGTTFNFTILAEPLPGSVATTKLTLEAMPVLVLADDNSLNQNLLKRLVGKLGHAVDVVSNGREAVAAVAQQPYDAVLMDVLMPEMDGLVAAEAICRRWPRGNRPRLIALTAMAGPGDQERCLRAGFDDYMSKPVRLDDLNEALKAAAGYRTNRETAGL